uniref:Uncharacterized protein n=1 Tax=Amphimedon queenslandica TaxID=400682 RepID=A0A1X7UF13_AMPQE
MQHYRTCTVYFCLTVILHC